MVWGVMCDGWEVDGGSQAIMYTCFFTACAALMVSVCVCIYVYIVKLQQYCRLFYEQCTKITTIFGLIPRSCEGGVELGTGNETDFVTCEVWNVLC